MAERDSSDRRDFLMVCIYAAWGIMGTVLGILGGIYLLWPPPLKKEGEWVEAGRLSQLPLNTPQELVFRRNRVDGWKITSEKATAWVVKESSDRVIAFGPQCPHLGCAYHWERKDRQFLCPCHGSVFAADGKVLAGPALRPLDRYEVKVEGDKLLLGEVRKSEETRG